MKVFSKPVELIPSRELVITLTEYEAEVLAKVCGNLGGTPNEGHPRRVISDLYYLLSQNSVVVNSKKFELSGNLFIENTNPNFCMTSTSQKDCCKK